MVVGTRSRFEKACGRVYDGREPHTVVILSLDTTTRGGSVAVTRDDQLLALVPGDAARSHSERLPGEIETALAQAGLQRARHRPAGGRDRTRRVHRACASAWPPCRGWP